MSHLFQVLLFSIVFLFFSCSRARYGENYMFNTFGRGPRPVTALFMGQAFSQDQGNTSNTSKVLSATGSDSNAYQSNPVATPRTKKHDYINCNSKNNTPVSSQATGSGCNVHNSKSDKHKGHSYINCNPQLPSSQATGSNCNVHNSKPNAQKGHSYINVNPTKLGEQNGKRTEKKQVRFAKPELRNNNPNTSDDEQDYDFPQNNAPVSPKVTSSTGSNSNASNDSDDGQDYDELPVGNKPVEQKGKDIKQKRVHFAKIGSEKNTSDDSYGEQNEFLKPFRPEDYTAWLAEENKKSNQKKMHTSNNHSGSLAETKSNCHANNNNGINIPLISLEEAQDKFGPKAVNNNDNDTGICDCICCIS